MDSIKLNDEELLTVIAFIERRGFHDAGVIVEILDHFSCKIEEKLTENPGMDLLAAMESAHRDFGTLGFYPISANYEANVRKKYKAIYRAHRNRLLVNPLYAISILLISIGFYFGSIWSDQHPNWWGINLASAVLWIVALTASMRLSFKFNLSVNPPKLYQVIMSNDFYLLIFIMIPGIHDKPLSHTGQVASGLCCAALCFYCAVRYLSLYATLRVGAQENSLVHGYLKQLKYKV